MILAIVGVVLGTVGALLLTRFLSSMLYGVGANDPTTLLSVATLRRVVGSLAPTPYSMLERKRVNSNAPTVPSTTPTIARIIPCRNTQGNDRSRVAPRDNHMLLS